MNRPVSAVAGAVTGALLALPFVSPPGVTLLLIAAAGVVAGAAVAAWLAGPLARPRPEAPAPPEDWAHAPARAAETVRAVLPVSEPAGQWWAKAAPTRPSPAAAPPRPAAPELASYAGGARVVQCPACGEFRVDVTHVPGGFAFRCRADDHHWEWQAGTPWPATVNVSRPRRTAF